MKSRMWTKVDKYHYDLNGYLIKKSFYTYEEIALLFKITKQDDVIKKHTYGRMDKEGFTTKLALWYSLGDNIYSAFARSERMVNGVEMFLEGKPCHFHTKLMQKEPKVGGAWEWHQDYGYWYDNGFLLPEMLSVMVAITRATKENGCLQVLNGSHKIGRINHLSTGEQVGADMKRVNEAMKTMSLVYVELEPGDTLFFHGNLLHRSDANKSDTSRFSLISAYNLARNKSFMDEPEASHTPIEKVENEKILKIGVKGVEETADFLSKDRDKEWKESIEAPK